MIVVGIFQNSETSNFKFGNQGHFDIDQKFNQCFCIFTLFNLNVALIFFFFLGRGKGGGGRGFGWGRELISMIKGSKNIMKY